MQFIKRKMLALVNVTTKDDPLTNNNFWPLGNLEERPAGGKHEHLREENFPAKNSGHKIILDVIYDTQRETRPDSSMAFLNKTFD